MKKSKVLERINLMQHVTRFNIHPVKHRQNIAEHTFGVAALVQLVGTEVNLTLRKLKSPLFVNVPKVLGYALFHDYEETVTTDIPYPLKKKLGGDVMDAIDEMSKETIRNDFKDLGLCVDSYSGWKDSNSEEFQLIKVCDYAELMIWTINNKNQFSGGNYEEILTNCRQLMLSYDLHQYSPTIVGLIHNSADDFIF